MNSLKVPSLLAAVLLSGSALAGEPRSASYAPREATAAACSDLKSELFKAAQEQATPLDAEGVVTLTLPQAALAGTPIEGYEKLPASEFAKGVDAAFIYIDNPEAGIPAGHYRVNVRANPEDIHEGKYQGTASLIDKDGKEVARLPADIETFAQTSARGGNVGPRAHLGLQQHTYDWNLDRFRPRVLLIIVSQAAGIIVIDLFNNWY
ncbi:hypothetical protein [Pyxidicoccus trucidator]|uniref:hypothetical protein n=1 Tax=Pyxidicoccus trucidator TaxID=2709662 RepID=UPI0013DD52A8|nr:hypothetical protein [Pyxidicoccus trucidator]